MLIAGLLNPIALLQQNFKRAAGRGHAALSPSSMVTAAQRTKQQVAQLCAQNPCHAPKQAREPETAVRARQPGLLRLFEFCTAPMHSQRARGQSMRRQLTTGRQRT